MYDKSLCIARDPGRSKNREGYLLKYLARRYLTFMTTKVTSKGQIVLPAEIRKQDDIRTGQEFELQRISRGKYHLQRKAKPISQGLIDWLLDCPEKGYFVPIESESTVLL